MNRGRGRPIKDLKGLRFSSLTVVSKAERARGGPVKWICLCDCGNFTRVPSNHLQQGHTKSCGCGRKGIKRDLAGEVFGRLTVLNLSEKKCGKFSIWNCRCSCGKEKAVVVNSLISGHSQSCGCLMLERISGPNSARYKHGKSGTKEYIAMYSRRRRARKIGSPGSFSDLEWQELKISYDYQCLGCGLQEPKVELSPDHIVPLSKGGHNDISNIQPLCWRKDGSQKGNCQSKKGVKIIDYRY